MAKNLADALKRRKLIHEPSNEFVLPAQDTGIEIEIGYGNNRARTNWVTPQLLSFWEKKTDASVRNGFELVLRGPMFGRQLSQAISAFFEAARVGAGGIAANLPEHSSAGVHIHINVMDEETSTDSLRSIFAITYLIEDLIFSEASEDRRYTSFSKSLRTLNSSMVASLMQPDTDRLVTNLSVLGDRERYYGLNTAAINRYGTVEYRYFPSVTSEAQLRNWVNLVHSIKRAALAFPLPMLPQVVSSSSAWHHFVTTYFGPWADKLLALVPYEAADKYLSALLLAEHVSNTRATVFEDYDAEESYMRRFSAANGATKTTKKATRQVGVAIDEEVMPVSRAVPPQPVNQRERNDNSFVIPPATLERLQQAANRRAQGAAGLYDGPITRAIDEVVVAPRSTTDIFAQLVDPDAVPSSNTTPIHSSDE